MAKRNTEKKHKVAIIGGGPSALAAAFELTNDAEARKRLEITIYQMGWRLGGKCATGRNDKNRIEEHGIHVFFGWYHNAFKMLQRAYEERNQTADGKNAYFTDCNDAFTPGGDSLLTWFAPDEGRWKDLAVKRPAGKGKPWEGGPPQMWTLTKDFLGSLLDMVGSMKDDHPARYKDIREGESVLLSNEDTGAEGGDLLDALIWKPRKRIRAAIRESIHTVLDAEEKVIIGKVHAHLKRIAGKCDALDADGSFPNNGIIKQLIRIIDAALKIIHEIMKVIPHLESHRRSYFALTTADFGLCLIKGLLKQVSFSNGKAYIPTSNLDEVEFSDWMAAQGADQRTIFSPIFRFMYNGTYAYPRGDNNDNGSISARAAILGSLLVFTANKGAPVYAFNAGCAEVFVAPIYQCLRDRGVKFEFFNKVTDIVPAPSNDFIQSIKIDIQARLKDKQKPYDPLMILTLEKEGKKKKLACWPWAPDGSQLQFSTKPEKQRQIEEEGVTHNLGKYNLESSLSNYKVGTKTLRAGRDFDQIILATPPRTLQYIGQKLWTDDSPWQNYSEQIGVVQTQQVQLWLRKTAKELGVDAQSWGLPKGTYVSSNSYKLPLTCWGDYSYLLNVEPYDKSYGDQPRFLGYFTSVLPEVWNIVDSGDENLNYLAYQVIRSAAVNYLQQSMAYFFKNEKYHVNPGSVDLKLLISGAWNKEGDIFPYVLTQQYFRANIDPSELYTQSLPGTGKYRIACDETGFENMFLAGDGTNNGYNFGCVEASVISGIRAARALLNKYNKNIPGSEPIVVPDLLDTIDPNFIYHAPDE